MSTSWNSFFTFRLIAPILLFLPIAPIFKVVLLYLTDTVDCWLYKWLINPDYDSTRFGYHVYDKLLDVYSETFIMLYLISFKIVPYQFYSYIMAALILRLIGVLMFINTNRTIYLKIFPDAFREFTLLILLSEYFPYNWAIFIKKNIILFFMLIYFIKMIFESYWHKESSKKE